MAKMCTSFIRHVFNCLINPVSPSVKSAVVWCSYLFSSIVPINRKPTESTIPLPKFIAYAFHCTHLPPSVAYHSLFLLSHLKSRYPVTSCAFGHHLFLTSYMLSLKVICNDTYSNKVSVFCSENTLNNDWCLCSRAGPLSVKVSTSSATSTWWSGKWSIICLGTSPSLDSIYQYLETA